MRHTLKIEPCYLEAIREGRKTFEIRYNPDRGFNTGDEVQFQPTAGTGNFVDEDVYEIIYVYSGDLCLKNYVVFGIKLIERKG